MNGATSSAMGGAVGSATGSATGSAARGRWARGRRGGWLCTKRMGAAALWVLMAAGCTTPPPAPVSAPPPMGLVDLLDGPAERALFDGMRAYDDGQYELSEAALRAALAGNLRSPRDKASAYKLLAFIYCTSNREAQCEASFKAARNADATFRLNRAESGHPLWGPVYRRLLRLP